MNSLSPEWLKGGWGLRVDSPRTCTHWLLSWLSMMLSRPHPATEAGVDTPALSKASCLGPHAQCVTELEFGYRPRSLPCARGLELRMKGDNLAGSSVCPAPSAGPAWGDIWGFLLALVGGVHRQAPVQA